MRNNGKDQWIRYEIIDGELFVTRLPLWGTAELPPHHKHQHVIGCIFAVLNDVVWVSYERLAQIQDEAGHFRGAPELVVEVLSPGKANEDRDRSAKLKLYSVTLFSTRSSRILDCRSHCSTN
jgi:hypothetical protein